MTQSKTTWDSLIQTLEDNVRAGRLDQVRSALMAPEILKAPRPYVARLSNIARRAHFSRLSLRLLRPYYHPKFPTSKEATSAELLEYASALQIIGATHESIRILERLSERHPQAQWALAMHHMSEWDYAAAQDRLEAIHGHRDLSPYDHRHIDVKRLKCLVDMENEGAEQVFHRLMPDLLKNNFYVLAANVLEIMAQHWVQMGAFARARELLSEAHNLLLDKEGMHRLFIEKWQVIADAMESRNPTGLDRLRQRALQFSHWETLRDLDYFRSIVEPAGPWAEWVYFGTPYPRFRARLERFRIFPEASWVCLHNTEETRWDPWFPAAAQGELAHRFVSFLARDYYRPALIGEIFFALFPDQYFDIEVSPNRVHQIAHRARAWMKAEGIPARLEEKGGSYRLHRDSSLALMGRKNLIRYTKTEFIFDRFREKQEVALSLKEWAERLGFDHLKAKRLLKTAQSSGLVRVLKHGQYSKYVLNSQQEKDVMETAGPRAAEGS